MSARPDLGRPAIQLAIFALAVAAGGGLEHLHWPLPWILGPLLVTAGAAMAGATIYAPPIGRRAGQWIVGSAIGLGLTADVAGQVLLWLPVMVLSALFAVLVAALLSRPFARLARIDAATAFFAMMPGGLAEMANIGHAVGARPEPIALSQTIRLTLIVCVLPALVTAAGYHGTFLGPAGRTDLATADLAFALAMGAAGVGLAMLVRLNNPWMIGAVLGAGLLAGSGQVEGNMPHPLYAFGQILIGIAIGARLRRDVLRPLVRVGWLTVLFVILLSGILYAGALVLARVSGLDAGSAILAVSAGGIAEMSLTAAALGLDVALVAAFHFVRAVVVNGFAAHIWSLLARRQAHDGER